MHLRTLLLPIALIGLLAACRSGVNTIERAESAAQPNLVADKRVVTDTTLARDLAVLSLNESTASGDLLKVQIVVENRARRAKAFNYRFEWIARDGMWIESPSSTWKTIRLQSGERAALTAVAPEASAVDFRLSLQER